MKNSTTDRRLVLEKLTLLALNPLQKRTIIADSIYFGQQWFGG
jgi:hypothetical protein